MKNCLLAIAALILSMSACKVENDINGGTTPNLPETPYDYVSVLTDVEDFELPENIPTGNGQNMDIISCCGNFEPGFSGNSVTTNILSNEQATLGRVLFYDARLSKNSSIACASCHRQDLAFSDDVVFSEGFGGKKTERNAMAIINPIVNNSFFWDSRERTLQDLAEKPIINHIEMGMEDMNALSRKLHEVPFYREMFEEAFGSDQINAQRISSALAQFTASIFKHDSKFDKGIADNFASFTELEKVGMGLFFSPDNMCASCHSGPNFSAQDGFQGEYAQTSGTAHNGLSIEREDYGKENGQFKIPSLRNIALTAPYMHDGRLQTLREVLEHYNSGVESHPNLDDKLMENGSPKKLGLTSIELTALEAFLHTLTSESITTDPKLANPFL